MPKWTHSRQPIPPSLLQERSSSIFCIVIIGQRCWTGRDKLSLPFLLQNSLYNTATAAAWATHAMSTSKFFFFPFFPERQKPKMLEGFE
jgi:hypothetical protein